MSKKAAVMGPLPPEVKALGKPASVHPVTGWVAAVDRVIDVRRLAPLASAGVMLILVVILAVVFALNRAQIGDGAWLFALLGGACLVGAVALVAYGLLGVRRPADWQAGRPGYLVYDDALVAKSGDDFDVIPWDAVQEMFSPVATGGNFRLVVADGKAVEINGWVENEGTLTMALIERVTAAQLPAALRVVGDGKRVQFGDLGVGRKGLSYKDKKIAWTEVSGMVIKVGRGRVLSVRQEGAMLAWCSVDIAKLPNPDLLQALISKTAPSRLLREDR